jgi:hypothetical protein
MGDEGTAGRSRSVEIRHLLESGELPCEGEVLTHELSAVGHARRACPGDLRVGRSSSSNSTPRRAVAPACASRYPGMASVRRVERGQYGKLRRSPKARDRAGHDRCAKPPGAPARQWRVLILAFHSASSGAVLRLQPFRAHATPHAQRYGCPVRWMDSRYS